MRNVVICNVDLLKMTVGKPLSGAEMTQACFIFLLMSNAASVSTQFNGFNCDANFHSRFPGENHSIFLFLNMEHMMISLPPKVIIFSSVLPTPVCFLLLTIESLQVSSLLCVRVHVCEIKSNIGKHYYFPHGAITAEVYIL